MYEDFRWNEWNTGHIAEHGVSMDEAEYVVNHPFRGWPIWKGEHQSFLAVGQTAEGWFIQVGYIFDEDGTVYVIHARPLNEREKTRARRRRK